LGTASVSGSEKASKPMKSSWWSRCRRGPRRH